MLGWKGSKDRAAEWYSKHTFSLLERVLLNSVLCPWHVPAELCLSTTGWWWHLWWDLVEHCWWNRVSRQGRSSQQMLQVKSWSRDAASSRNFYHANLFLFKPQCMYNLKGIVLFILKAKQRSEIINGFNYLKIGFFLFCKWTVEAKISSIFLDQDNRKFCNYLPYYI